MWPSWFGGGRKDHKETARDSIVNLRGQLLMLEKREDYIQKQIDEEMRKARANATTNKRLATAALRNKKTKELELDRIAGTRLTLETQVNALESASINAETMLAMKQGAQALKGIHTSLNVDKVDETMDSIREQMELTNEISDAISNPVGMGNMVDEDELNAELEAMQQEELDERLAGAERVPSHMPSSPVGVTSGRERVAQKAEEDDEEAQLRQLQAELAM